MSNDNNDKSIQENGRPGLDQIEDALLSLGKQMSSDGVSTLRHPRQETSPEWGGADVVVTSDFSWNSAD